MAHVALAHDSTLGVILRHSVGAIPNAILATDAGVGTVQNHARNWVLGVSLHRASDQAGGFQTVIAAHRQVMTLRIRVMPALHFANSPPIDCGRIAVLFVTSHYAAFATYTLRHIEVKTILFADPQRAFWDQRSGLKLDLYQRTNRGREQCALHQRKLV